jgi:hypothetical protein
MGYYVSTTGLSNVAIGICGRCSRKFPLVDLMEDPNTPGLRVCREDVDDYDPYRLPPRETEDITLEFPRPDERLVTTSVAPGTPAWPATAFPDDGFGSAQLPTNGVMPPLPGQPFIPKP